MLLLSLSPSSARETLFGDDDVPKKKTMVSHPKLVFHFFIFFVHSLLLHSRNCIFFCSTTRKVRGSRHYRVTLEHERTKETRVFGKNGKKIRKSTPLLLATCILWGRATKEKPRLEQPLFFFLFFAPLCLPPPLFFLPHARSALLHPADQREKKTACFSHPRVIST